MSSNEILQLVDRCINGLEVCVMRLPQNYKALYRLAHLYFNYKSKKDSSKCRQLLLGEYKCKDGSSINGLFSSRKNTDFFNVITSKHFCLNRNYTVCGILGYLEDSIE